MPSINGTPTLPGVFSQVQAQLLPSVTGGIRVACYLGTGKLTNSVIGESVIRGSVDTTANVPFTVTTVTDGTHLVVSSTAGMSATDTIVQGTHTTTITTVTDGTHLVVGSTAGWLVDTNDDALAHTATILDGTTITDQNYATYELGVDYSLAAGGVGWLTGAASITGTTSSPYGLTGVLSGKTLIFQVGNALPTTVMFTTEFTNTTVVATINTAYGDTIASVNGAHVELSTGTLGTPVLFNTSITIENGTANTILGFTSGSLVSAPSRPALGVTYFVNYEWAKFVGDGQGSFTPQFYFLQNFSTITNVYGNVGGGAGDNVNTANMDGAWTLPIAAQLAQENGASIVCLMQLNPALGSTASQVRSALTQLFIPNINIVVSLAGDANAMLIPDITNHVETASSTINRLERTAFIGFTASPIVPPLTDSIMLGYATAASSNRVVVVNQYNTTYSMFIGTNTVASTVDGTMAAAALAAIRTNPAFDVAQPLTREVLSGIATTNTLAQSEKTIFANNGVLVIDNISGSPKVVFGTTTEYDTILNQLYQVTEISDYVAQTLRGLLDPIFVGQKLLTNTPSQVETVTGAILTSIEQDNIITDFVQPSATVNPTQPTQILLQVGISPVLELDTIFITLGLNLV